MSYFLFRYGVCCVFPHHGSPVLCSRAGTIVGALNKRGGLIMATELNDDGSQIAIRADVPLAEMFGYSTDLRSSTQGTLAVHLSHRAPIHQYCMRLVCTLLG